MHDSRHRAGWLLAGIVAIAALLRIALVAQGGQFFFADEGRFMRSIALYQGLVAGKTGLVIGALDSPQHTGFVLLGALLAPVSHALAGLAGSGDWSQAAQVHASLPLLALVLSVCSILNVWLVHRVARAHGAGPGEALLAALLAAVAASLSYHARHLLPYDAALAAFLGALLLLPRAGEARIACALGGLAGLGFSLYNGYWFLVPLLGAAVLHAAAAQRLKAGVLYATGAILVFGLLMLPGTWLRGVDFWREFRHFGSTAKQGLFAEGWSFPWAYLWNAESWLGAAVLGALVAGITTARREVPGRVRRWLLLAAGLGLAWFLCSTVLEKIVLYGRTIRPLTVLLCLAGGWALDRLLPAAPRVRGVAVAILLALAALNLRPHFLAGFPRETAEEVWRDHGVPKLALGYRGVDASGASWPRVTRPDLALVNAIGIFPVRASVTEPAGTVLRTWLHPHAIAAYRYEGHPPGQRAALRAHPPAIRLIQLAQPTAVPAFPPVDQLARPDDIPDGYDPGHER